MRSDPTPEWEIRQREVRNSSSHFKYNNKNYVPWLFVSDEGFNIFSSFVVVSTFRAFPVQLSLTGK